MRGACFVGHQTTGLPDTLDNNRTDHQTGTMKKTKKQRIKKYATAIDNADLNPVSGFMTDAASEVAWRSEAKAVIKVANAEIRKATLADRETIADLADEIIDVRADNICLRTERDALLQENTRLESARQAAVRHADVLLAAIRDREGLIGALRAALRVRTEQMAQYKDEAVRTLVTAVADGDGFTTQIGGALIVKCDERGQTDLHREIERLRDMGIRLKEKSKRAGLIIRDLKHAQNAASDYEYALLYDRNGCAGPLVTNITDKRWKTQQDAETSRKRMMVPSNWKIVRTTTAPVNGTVIWEVIG